MPLEGRIEKRIAVAVPVYLVSALKSRETERALTGNVSSRGSRVVTEQRWKPAEHLWLSPMSGGFHLAAQVVYCQALANGQFAVGLLFRSAPINWEDSLLAVHQS